jgi:murein DD-endopeptidase MepM/ murein hydrolase activator NlpD
MRVRFDELRLGALVLGLVFLAGCATTSEDPVKFEPAHTAYYTVPVQKGEALKAIAERWQVREEDLLAVNNLYDRNAVASSESIRIPAYGRVRDAAVSVGASKASATASRAPEQPPREAVASAEPVGTVMRPTPIERVPIPEPKSATGQKPRTDQSWWSWMMSPGEAPQLGEPLQWPVKGRVISAFGAAADGARNDGINISVSLGTPVHAAAAGTVTYVGDDLKAYGNLILIRHENGFVTAYAHCGKITVARGESVAAGQAIATAGATGDVDQPQLHFELRQGTKPIDPLPYLVATD